MCVFARTCVHVLSVCVLGVFAGVYMCLQVYMCVCRCRCVCAGYLSMVFKFAGPFTPGFMWGIDCWPCCQDLLTRFARMGVREALAREKDSNLNTESKCLELHLQGTLPAPSH